MDICLQVLKESNKRRLESYTARNRVLIISHITFRDCRVHIFNDNRPRNSCISNGQLSVINVFRITEFCIFFSYGSHCVLTLVKPLGSEDQNFVFDQQKKSQLITYFSDKIFIHSNGRVDKVQLCNVIYFYYSFSQLVVRLQQYIIY